MGDGQELHVLAVDDSLIDRKLIERLLKVSCCKVTAVESGERALQYLGLVEGDKSAAELDSLKVNLVLTDYSMPEMTGYELLKKIKGSKALKGIPVVIMSSENIMTRIDRCLEEGAEEFLMKPVKLSDLKRIKDVVLKGCGNANNNNNNNNEGNKIEESRKRKRSNDDDGPLLSPARPFSSSSITRDLLITPPPKCSRVHIAVDQ